MNMMATETPESAPRKPKLAPARKFLKKVVKSADIARLRGMEQWLRRKDFRMLVIQGLGLYLLFHGIALYSPRVADIVLGVGVILAAERQ
jgi:hypothetical protein